MNYRSRPLLDLAHRVNYCQLQLPGVCETYSANGCEPAHSNSQRHGKAMSLKAHDFFHCPACHSCHVELDQGRKFSKEQKAEFFMAGWERTMAYYFREGWIGVVK